MADRGPCPGCGRLIARRGRESDAPRFEHRCPHGRRCIAWRSFWDRGSWEHWRACPECCETTRLADGTEPGVLDCWSCTTPLPFDPDPLRRYCPPGGMVKVTGVHCAKCGAESVYRITLDGLDRYARAGVEPS